MSEQVRLVDANALLAAYDAAHVGPPGGARKLIENAPTIEAVPVEWITEQEYSENEALSVAANAVLKAWLTREDEA